MKLTAERVLKPNASEIGSLSTVATASVMIVDCAFSPVIKALVRLGFAPA